MKLSNSLFTPQEWEIIDQRLGRQATEAEVAMLSAMWSEHCSYKHSRYFLKDLPQKAPHLLVGPGENAGVIQISPDLALVFKIESHNHPSAVVPYQGAATGVGGILRDIFAMGARPVVLLNSLHFDLSHSRGNQLLDRVVEGLSDYGNSTGIPTLGGETRSYPWFRTNPLVNAFCMGRIHPQKLTLSSGAKPGDLVLYFGNQTGRDGLEGAVFASLNLTEQTKKQKSAVQVADPFMGKVLLEASLALSDRAIPSAMQDMGAAGITSSCSEMAHGSGWGIRIFLDQVPARAQNMRGEEFLLSESQERMVAAIPPEKKEEAQRLLESYPLHYSWIGEILSTPTMEVIHRQKTIAHLPLDLLLGGCPIQEYPHLTPEILRKPPQQKGPPAPSIPPLEHLLSMIKNSPIFQSNQWIFQQFDHQVGLSAISSPGRGDTIFYDWESDQVISLSIQSKSGWMVRDPYRGTLATLALALRHSCAQGAYPLGLTNCLNFPSPQNKSTIFAFGQTCQGLHDFCQVLEIPVTGGNVSFYNESETLAIVPTPVFVLVGKSCLPKKSRPLWEEGKLYMTGSPKFNQGEFFLEHLIQNGQEPSLCQVPAIDLEREKTLAHRIIQIRTQFPRSFWVREIGGGGLFKRVLENWPEGFDIFLRTGITGQDLLFGEGPESYLFFVSTQAPKEVESKLKISLGEFGFFPVGKIARGKGYLYLNEEKILSYDQRFRV